MTVPCVRPCECCLGPRAESERPGWLQPPADDCALSTRTRAATCSPPCLSLSCSLRSLLLLLCASPHLCMCLLRCNPP